MNLTGFRVFFCKMKPVNNVLLSPVGVRGMKVLDKDKFLRNVVVPILKVKEENLSKIIQHCKPYLLRLEKFKPVRDSGEDIFNKIIYLNPEKVAQWLDFPYAIREDLSQNGVDVTNFYTKEVQLCYDNWRIDLVFKAVLPDDEEIVSGYSQIGHIIHLNLREHLLEYRQLIGQVLLDKIKTCRTVVNKSNIIDNTYRNFNMDVIAGENDFVVTVKENRCTFQFDFAKVYWNPRLCKEHERILNFLKPGDVLFDVFCGVGPFAIPAAKKGCKVYANDLNPDSFKWLNNNAKKNKVKMSMFKSFNQDGKDFINVVFKNYIMECSKSDDRKIHVTMNLPAMAVEFLKYFKGLINNDNLKDTFDCDIIIYVYCFSTGNNPVTRAKTLVNESMSCDMSAYILDVFDVRNVSPKKEMMRVTIKLTKDVLFMRKNCHSDGEPPLKKLCMDTESTGSVNN